VVKERSSSLLRTGLVLCAFFAIVLAACGGGDTVTESVSPTDGDPPIVDTASPLTGDYETFGRENIDLATLQG